MLNELRWEVIVCFLLILVGIADHHCLNFLFILICTCKWTYLNNILFKDYSPDLLGEVSTDRYNKLTRETSSFRHLETLTNEGVSGCEVYKLTSIVLGLWSAVNSLNYSATHLTDFMVGESQDRYNKLTRETPGLGWATRLESIVSGVKCVAGG